MCSRKTTLWLLQIIQKSAFAASETSSSYFAEVFTIHSSGLTLEHSPQEQDQLKRLLDEGSLRVERMGHGYAWLNTRMYASLLDASNFVRTLTERQWLPQTTSQTTSQTTN